MSDPLAPVVPGDSPGLLLNSQTINLTMDAVRAFHRGGNIQPTPVEPITQIPSRIEVRVQATSTIQEYFVVGLGDVLIDPTDSPRNALDTPLFESATPADDEPFGVAVAGIETGKIGRVVVQGVCVVSVAITDTDHRYAKPATGNTTNLVSADSGPALLLQEFDSTGTRKVCVLLQGNDGGSSPLTTKGDIYVHSGTGDARHPVGTDGQVLTADSSGTNGLGWRTPLSVLGTDNQIVRIDGNLSGKIQNSQASIDDSGVITCAGMTLTNGRLTFGSPSPGDSRPFLRHEHHGDGDSGHFLDVVELRNTDDDGYASLICGGIITQGLSYSPAGGGAFQFGADGTDSLGNEFHGGICTKVGTFSIGGVIDGGTW